MITIQGKGVSVGVAAGPLYYYRREDGRVRTWKVEDVQTEWKRFKDAQMAAVGQLGELAEEACSKVGEDEVFLFEIHQMLVMDPSFENSVEQIIKGEMINAEAAVFRAGEDLAQLLGAMEDAYMKERAADIRDVSRRILQILGEVVQEGIDSEVPVIVAADDLAPSETIRLDKTRILGLVTAQGSASSHTAILARAMGIPAIVGLGDALKEAYDGCAVIIDGEAGTVVIEPDEEIQMHIAGKQEKLKEEKQLLEQLKGQDNVTKDGRRIGIYCNISSPEEVPLVLANDGGGIGLFRSEFLYLNSDHDPTEEEQFEAYKKVLTDMEGKEVIIRTCDIGADKQIEYFDLPEEENPAMGLRGLRVSLTRPELFRTQLRALYRASVYGKLGIMFPMVTSVWEVREAKHLCESVKKELEAEEIPYSEAVETGIMIETPAAALISDQLAGEVDFFSCGTNDLTQYTLACDRQNHNLDRFCDLHHPAILRLLQMVCDNAHKNGIRAGICGEMAADIRLTETLLDMGIDELSVLPTEVLKVRKAVREINRK